MMCPTCWVKAACYDSRPRLVDGNTRRRYRCPKCGNRFSTLEFMAESVNGAPMQAKGVAEQVHHAITAWKQKIIDVLESP